MAHRPFFAIIASHLSIIDYRGRLGQGRFYQGEPLRNKNPLVASMKFIPHPTCEGRVNNPTHYKLTAMVVVRHVLNHATITLVSGIQVYSD
jgi:hypothetical protein